jgi:group I intron endonuclease
MEIYKITNKINGKFYIGQTINNFKRRYDSDNWWKCKRMSLYLKNAVNKYGNENFQVEILEKDIKDEETLNEREIFYIENLNSVYPNGYNLMCGGCSNTKRTHSLDTREKISNAAKRKNGNKPYIFKNHKTGEIISANLLSQLCKDKKLLNSEMSLVYRGLVKQHRYWTLPDTKLKRWKIKSPAGEIFILIQGEFSPFCQEKGIQRSNLTLSKKNGGKGSHGWNILEIYEE